MVAAWRERGEHPVEIGIGLLDLFAGRESTRAHVAAFVLGDALTRVVASNMTPKQAREFADKAK